MSGDAERYYPALVEAFVRGTLDLPRSLPSAELYRLEAARGLPLYRFKRTGLARVRKVLGILHGLNPTSLLDIGSGRGTFLWPLLDAFPRLPVLAADRNRQRLSEILAVRAGGIVRLNVACLDARQLAVTSESFDIVTILEVLEHLNEPRRAIEECLRAARRYVLASVPLHEDDNPEHLHRFERSALAELFLGAGASKVTFDFVPNHQIVIATV